MVLRRLAFLRVSTDETQNRLGILANVLQWPVWGVSSFMYLDLEAGEL